MEHGEEPLWSLEDEVIERVGLQEWLYIVRAHRAQHPEDLFETFRDDDGVAQWRFRGLTPTERHLLRY